MRTATLTQPRPVRRARTIKRPPTSASRSCRQEAQALRRRTRSLFQSEIDFIPNKSFLADDAEEQIKSEALSLEQQTKRDTELPRDLPAHLARLCETKLLAPEEEAWLFRRMNFLKFRANAIRGEIDADRPDAKLVGLAEECLAEAKAIRDRIVQANTRLAMSIVKKFVTPQNSFDEMLSDGIDSLMQAVEKFDYDRGFRFSTYAYRSIARNAYRRINDRLKANARFAANSGDYVFDVADDGGSSSAYDQAWDNMRGMLAQFMSGLDRRERFIIRSRYALGSHRKVRTFQCLADKLGVSKERARQLEQRAVAKLRSFAGEQQTEELFGTALS